MTSFGCYSSFSTYSQLANFPNAFCSLGILSPVLSHGRLMEVGFPRAVKQMSKMRLRTVTNAAFCVCVIVGSQHGFKPGWKKSCRYNNSFSLWWVLIISVAFRIFLVPSEKNSVRSNRKKLLQMHSCRALGSLLPYKHQCAWCHIRKQNVSCGSPAFLSSFFLKWKNKWETILKKWVLNGLEFLMFITSWHIKNKTKQKKPKELTS